MDGFRITDYHSLGQFTNCSVLELKGDDRKTGVHSPTHDSQGGSLGPSY